VLQWDSASPGLLRHTDSVFRRRINGNRDGHNCRSGPKHLSNLDYSCVGQAKLPGTKKGFLLLPRRWVLQRSFAWAAHFRRLAQDYEQLPETLAALHFLAFAILMLRRFIELMTQS
jgi:Transposase DDE domain